MKKCYVIAVLLLLCGNTKVSGQDDLFKGGTFTNGSSYQSSPTATQHSSSQQQSASSSAQDVNAYYTNGTLVLNLTINKSAITVYSGGIGVVYTELTKPKVDGGYYVFGGETSFGFTKPRFRLPFDFSVLYMNDEIYHRTDKATYDRKSQGIQNFTSGSGGYSGSSSSSSSSSANHENMPSRHGDTTCKGCGGSGRCTACGGTGNSIKEEYDSVLGRSVRTTSNCGVCRGTGNCGVCHGSGKIHY